MKKDEMLTRILEGEDPRAVIAAAASEVAPASIEPSTAIDEVATVTKKVVRNGKVVKKKVKKYKKKRILSAAQKRALKKAQQASKKGSANAKRKKSLRKAATLEDDQLELMNTIICPYCGCTEVSAETDPDENQTICTCPDCEHQFVLVDVETFAEMMGTDDGEEDGDDGDLEMDVPDEWEDIADEEDGTDNIPESTDPPAEAPAEPPAENPEGEPYFEDGAEDPLFFEDPE